MAWEKNSKHPSGIPDSIQSHPPILFKNKTQNIDFSCSKSSGLNQEA